MDELEEYEAERSPYWRPPPPPAKRVEPATFEHALAVCLCLGSCFTICPVLAIPGYYLAKRAQRLGHGEAGAVARACVVMGVVSSGILVLGAVKYFVFGAGD